MYRIFSLVVAFVFAIPFSAHAQTLFRPDKGTYYVLAPSGLNIRQSPDANSAKLKSLPYGSAVTVVEMPSWENSYAQDWIVGFWTKVQAGSTVGYAFSPYLSPLPAPGPFPKATEPCYEETNSGIAHLLDNYLKTKLKETSPQVVLNKNQSEEEDYYERIERTYGKLIHVRIENFYEGRNVIVEFPGDLFSGYIFATSFMQHCPELKAIADDPELVHDKAQRIVMVQSDAGSLFEVKPLDAQTIQVTFRSGI